MRWKENSTGRFGSRAAFTLVELLVVVAIVTVLAAMLLPALAQARAAARETTCRSNLHQVYMAVGAYADDNRGDLPVAIDLSSSRPTPWVALSPRGLNYILTTAVFDCPSDKTRTPSSAVWPGNGHYYNYSWHDNRNQGYLWWFYNLVDSSGTMTLGQSRNLSRLRRPTFDILAGDGHTHVDTNGFYYNVDGGFQGALTEQQWDWTRHTSGAVNVYADGHIGRIQCYAEMQSVYWNAVPLSGHFE